MLVLALAAGGVFWIGRRQSARYGRQFLADARAAEQAGQLEQAVGRYAQAIGVAPGTVDAYGGIAALLHRIHRDDEADYWMERLLAENPQSLAAHVARGRAQLARGRQDEAESDAQWALARAPNDLAALALARDINLARQHFDEARAQGRLIVQQDATSPDAYLALADIELRAKQPREAIAVLNEAVAKGAGVPSLRFARINLLLDDGQLAEAKKTVAADSADAELPEGLVQYVDARIAMDEEDWSKAVRSLEAVRGMFASSPQFSRHIKYWLGECYGHLEDLEGQLACYEEAIKMDPSWAPPLVAMARALLRAGRIEKALAAFAAAEVLPQLPPEFWIERTRALLLANLGRPPERRDWAPVEKALAEAQQGNSSLAASLLRADVLSAMDRTADAEKLLTEIRDQDPRRIEPWLGLASLAARQGRAERAAQLLKEAEKQSGDGLRLRLGQADCLLPQDFQRLSEKPPSPAGRTRQEGRGAGGEGILQTTAANYLRQLAEAPPAWSDKDRVALWRELASRSLDLGDTRLAAQLYRQVAAKLPDDLAVEQQLFDIAAGENDLFTMNRSLEQIERIGGESPLWDCDRAAWLEALAATSSNPAADFAAEALEPHQAGRGPAAYLGAGPAPGIGGALAPRKCRRGHRELSEGDRTCSGRTCRGTGCRGFLSPRRKAIRGRIAPDESGRRPGARPQAEYRRGTAGTGDKSGDPWRLSQSAAGLGSRRAESLRSARPACRPSRQGGPIRRLAGPSAAPGGDRAVRATCQRRSVPAAG